MIHDDVDRHLAEAGSLEAAAEPFGVYLAWCANHQLLSEALCRDAAELVLRVRYRDIGGAQLALAGCAGVLADEHLNAEGRQFTRKHYAAYLDDYRRTRRDLPQREDPWTLYDRLAPALTRALMTSRGRRTGAIRSGRWWEFWK